MRYRKLGTTGVRVAAVAVAWVLGQAGVTAAIAGARRRAQVDGWIAAGELVLMAEDLAGLERAGNLSGAVAA